MGRIKAGLSARSVAKLARIEGMHAIGDPPGLYLCVKGGGCSWILRYSLNGKRPDHGIGSYADLTLAEAREKARELRKLVLQAIDPIESKRRERALRKAAIAVRMTFDQSATAYIKAHADGWRNPKHRQQWQNTIETYVAPVIGPIDVALVDTPHVLKILEPIWKTKTETATRVRGRIEKVLGWATVRGYRTGDNPARWSGHLSELLASPSKLAKVDHHPALPYQQIGAFVRDLRQMEGIGASALEFAILTAARSGEVRGATWPEIDLRARKWTIPAERMKAARQHVVPLSDAAVAVLRKMEACRLGDLVFPGAKEGKPISDMTLTAVLRRMGRSDVTPHGFRSSFRDWQAEVSAYPHEMAEMALAHTIGDRTERAYRRGDLFAKRVRMMTDWAGWCARPIDKAHVLPLRAERSKTAPAR